MRTKRTDFRNLKLLYIVVFVFLINIIAAGFTDVFAQGEERVVRVFYPLQQGFTQQDGKGDYSGYTYDFLMDIAQLTGWNYEFIVVDQTNENMLSGLEAVKNGEIDLLCAMVNVPELQEEYLYSSIPYGSTNYTLVTLEHNRELNGRTLFDYPDLRIALISNANEQNRLLEDYCAESGLHYLPVYAEDMAACYTLVESGQADAMILKDVTFEPGYKTVMKFADQPFYFASGKGGGELMDQLNHALVSISTARPDLQGQRFNKYFTKPSDHVLNLTKEEISYLEGNPVLRVAVFTGRAPIQDYDPKTGQFSGAMVDILNLISEKSGLKFEMIPVGNKAEAYQLIQKGEVEIIAGLPHSYSAPGKLYEINMLLTSPVLHLPVVRADTMKVGADQQGPLVYFDTLLFAEQENVRYSESVQEILQLVEDGAYAEAYVDGYSAQNYQEQGNYRNVVLSLTPYGNYPLCLGVARKEDNRLINILEQTIAVVTSAEVENILYQNTSHMNQSGMMDLIKRNPLPFMIGGLSILVLVVVLLVALLLKTSHINRLISKEKVRYQMLSQVDGITHLFNSISFRKLAEQYLSKANSAEGGTLLVMDIDHFKQINDSFGHLTGDQALSGLAALLRSVFREEDIIGRIGGDEFAVLLKDVSNKEIVEGRCRHLLLECANLNAEFKMTLSIGGASFRHSTDYEDLFKLADAALYEVKQQGRNGFRIFSVMEGE